MSAPQSPLTSPSATSSLRARGATLASTAVQRATLDAVPLARGDFDASVRAAGWPAGLTPERVEVLQINVGRLCNMACRHCHVDAGPDRVAENMEGPTIDRCLALLDHLDATTVDITGGAPELNPHFRYLVEQCVARGRHVIDRCNLTILLLPKYADLPAWLGARGVEIVASLPHHRKPNTDAQRGDGTFERSMEALRRLNAAGYGQGDPHRILTLMHNPAGAFLPAGQASMQREWQASLLRHHDVRFDRLIALNNMPISRYLEWLVERGNLQAYMEMLTNAWNPSTLGGLMCRNTLSIGWDGSVYDCDFNQMLDLPAAVTRPNLRDLDLDQLAGRAIRTGRHCFGCTAGAGSSCGGATT